MITTAPELEKLLDMSMLAEFLDIRKDSRPIFSGLKIADNKELCEAWMHQSPASSGSTVFGSSLRILSMIQSSSE